MLSLKIFDAQLTPVPAAKDVAEQTRRNSQAGILIKSKNKKSFVTDDDGLVIFNRRTAVVTGSVLYLPSISSEIGNLFLMTCFFILLGQHP